MTKNYTAAIIGVGAASNSGSKGGGHQIAYTHAQAYRENAHTTLIAGADINAGNLAAYQKHFEVAHGFADDKQMLAEVRPDIVSICTYVGLHRPMLEACARAGVKMIFCEKPFVSSPADLDAVDAIVAETGVKIVIAHVRRYAPGFERGKAIVQSGVIGKPTFMFAGIEGWDLSEWGSHWLDQFRFFMNDAPIAWVMGQTRTTTQRGYGHAMEDHAIAYAGFKDGPKCFLDGGKDIGTHLSVQVAGTEGLLQLLGGDASEIVIINKDGRNIEKHPCDWQNCWTRSLNDMVTWLDGGAEPIIGYTHTRGSAEFNLAAYVSALRGDRVDLPLHAPEINRWPLEYVVEKK